MFSTCRMLLYSKIRLTSFQIFINMKEKPNFIKSIFPGKMEGLRNVIKDKLVKSKVRTLTNTFSVLNMHKGQFYVV